MKVTVKDRQACQIALRIIVDQEQIAKTYAEFYQEAQRGAQLPGFRKGKAPLALVRQHYEAKAADVVLQDLITRNYQAAVEQEKLSPLGTPEVSEVDFQPPTQLAFCVTVDLQPEVELTSYSGIRLKKKSAVVSDAEIEQVLARWQERYAEFTPIRDRPTRAGDYAVMDMTYSVDGAVARENKNSWVWISDPLFVPGLAQELEGLALEQLHTFTLPAPADFPEGELAGKLLSFSVTVHEIHQKKLPALDDAFSKQCGFDSIAAARQRIGEELQLHKDQQQQQDLREQLVTQLTAAMPIAVPPGLLQKQRTKLLETVRQRMRGARMSEAVIAEEEKKSLPVVEAEALKQVRAYFIVERIGQAEGIAISEEQMAAHIQRVAQEQGKKPEDIFQEWKRKDALDEIHWELREDSIMRFLLERAVVEDAAPEMAAVAR